MKRIFSLGLLCLLVLVSLVQVFAQSTPGGTIISNQATATYQDGSGNTLNAVSNTVTVTIANVAGLTITPDGAALTNATPLTVKTLTYTVTNTGNFSQSVVYKASGASMVVSGPATVLRAVIDINGNGTIDPGDTDIFTNGTDVTSGAIAQNASQNVLVEVQVQAVATSGSTITVNLGDTSVGGPSFDSQPNDSSASGVITSNATAINGILEAKGSQTFSVLEDAKIRVTLTAPTGPLAPGSDINYSAQACNDSVNTPVNAVTLSGGPVGNNSSVYIIAPIPANTSLKAGQTFPSSTLYSTDPLSVAPTAATWTATAPAVLSTVTRVAFATGNSIATGACSASYPFIVTINPGVNPTTTPFINEIVDAFGTNSLNTTITDQSGDPTGMAGDGNANFDESPAPGSSDGNGVLQQTAVSGTPELSLGPVGDPQSTQNGNYSSNCQHYSISTWPLPDFNSISGTYTFTAPKEIKNTGTMPLSFGLIAGFKVQDHGLTSQFNFTGATAGVLFDNAPDIVGSVSFDGGATWTNLNSYGGLNSLTSVFTADPVATQAPFNNLILAPGQSATFLLRWQIPATRMNGKNNLFLTIYSGSYFAGTTTPLYGNGYNVVNTPAIINAVVAGSCPGPQTFESTGDVLIGNSLDVQKSVAVTNSTGVGAATDAVPGAQINYTLTITGQPQNATTQVYSFGTGVGRWGTSASTVIVTEDGNAAPNNWGSTTNQVVGSASCSAPATISGDSAGSTSLTFQLTNPVTAGQVVTCTFSRIIK